MATAKKPENQQQADAIPLGELTGLFATLAQQSIEGYAEAWNPTTYPATIAGKVTDRDWIPSDYGDDYPVLTIAVNGDPSNRRSVHCMHTTMRTQTENVAVGDLMAITYKGPREQKNPRSGVQKYEDYSVALAFGDGSPKAVRVKRVRGPETPAGGLGPGQYQEGTLSGAPARVLRDAPRSGSDFGDEPAF